jgi:CelD/BcsL family acetyltransferase involved in cellulose biosynthesis
MAPATPAALTLRTGLSAPDAIGEPAAALKHAGGTDLQFTIHDDLSSVAPDWRAFEQQADCTVFQSYAWLSTWQRHIGQRRGVAPLIVIGRDRDGAILFLLPLAIEPSGFARRLTWLGAELGDYNAPLLAPDFSRRVTADRFVQLWDEITQRVRCYSRGGYDLIRFEKMPETVGAQPNPFLQLPVELNPSGAYLTHLTADWESFYIAKRSSATRRRDRTKRKRLAEIGEVSFVTAEKIAERRDTLETLMRQKSRSLAQMGAPDIFARTGAREFYLALATEPATQGLVHLSRLHVGSTAAATNLGLVFRGRYSHVLASYDDGDVSRFGPGVAHLHDLMRYAIERGCGIFDFTVGDERYKREWCDTEIKLYDHVSAATGRGALVTAALLAKRGVKRWIKQTPVVWDIFTKLRSALGSFRASRS